MLETRAGTGTLFELCSAFSFLLFVVLWEYVPVILSQVHHVAKQDPDLEDATASHSKKGKSNRSKFSLEVDYTSESEETVVDQCVGDENDEESQLQRLLLGTNNNNKQ
jgi:hypothetical protein